MADRREAESGWFHLPRSRYLTAIGSSDTSLLFLADLLTIVASSLAAQRVQPCPRNLSHCMRFARAVGIDRRQGSRPTMGL